MLKSKTVIVGIVMMALGGLDLLAGSMLGFTFLADLGIDIGATALIGNGLMAIFMRLGIAKGAG